MLAKWRAFLYQLRVEIAYVKEGLEEKEEGKKNAPFLPFLLT